MYECDVCKKYSMQGGSCYGGRRNCLYFEKEPRGRVLQETFLIDYGWNPSALVKRGEKLETKDGMELTVVTVHHVEFLYVPEVFGFDLFEDCVDRFLFGVADETASVHHHYVGRG